VLPSPHNQPRADRIEHDELVGPDALQLDRLVLRGDDPAAGAGAASMPPARLPLKGSRATTHASMRGTHPADVPTACKLPYRVSRRQALGGIAAATVWRPGAAETAPVHSPAEGDSGPVFSPTGPDAELYGAAEGFPIQFALFGSYGQRICIDPASKLVMVHTSVGEKTEIWRLWSALVKQFGNT
jgi:hypothetical protein